MPSHCSSRMVSVFLAPLLCSVSVLLCYEPLVLLGLQMSCLAILRTWKQEKLSVENRKTVKEVMMGRMKMKRKMMVSVLCPSMWFQIIATFMNVVHS